MHIAHKDDTPPLESNPGEIIYELIGRAVGQPSERHSVAYAVIKPGKSSRLHKHTISEESYYILRGRAHMRVGDEEAILEPGQSVLIPAETSHQISNLGEENLEFLAVCVPAWAEHDNEFLDGDSR